MNNLKEIKEKLNSLTGILNHRVTKLENSVWWIKWILSYVAGLATILIGKTILF